MADARPDAAATRSTWVAKLVSVAAVDSALFREFDERGVVRLRGVFSGEDAKRMRDAVWFDLLHSEGVVRDDPRTWRRRTPRSKLARAKRDAAFEALFGEQLRSFADDI